MKINSLLQNLSVLFLLFASFFAKAQDNSVEMADTMRSNGKIYVVITVISIILAGILIFLMIIDRKVRKMENKSKKD